MKPKTFTLLKPDAFNTRKVDEILGALEKNGFAVLAQKLIQKPTPEEVDAHLEDLKSKNEEAYNRNRGFLLEGPLLAIALERTDDLEPIEELRKLIGPTDPAKAPEGTIRSLSKDSLETATAEGRGLGNLIHASDSAESVDKETFIWLGDPY